MSLSILDYLYQVVLPTATVAELTDATPTPAVKLLSAMAAGDVLPQFIGGHGAAPAVDFRSPQLKTILDALGLYGTSGTCDLHYRSGSNLSTRAATGLRIRCLSSLIYWTGIQAGQDQIAEIACRLVPTWDGSNAPMTPAGATACPALSLPAQYYTLGPVSINGAAVAGLTGWSLDLNPQIHVEASDGDAYPSWCGVDSHAPVLTLTTRTLAQFATVGVEGLPLNGSTGLVFYLRAKKTDGAGCLADASGHIKFMALNGMAYVDNNIGGAGGPAGCGLRVALRRANTSASHCLSVNTASAIT